MNTREITENYRTSQWLEVIKDRQNSGLSVKDYCERAGIKRNKYYYWQRKIREAAYQETLEETKLPTVLPNGWAQLVPSIAQKESLSIQVNGCHIEVDNNTDLELLKRICITLRDI